MSVGIRQIYCSIAEIADYTKGKQNLTKIKGKRYQGTTAGETS